MLRVTFYSYKGGVGRSLTLLNVAAELRRRGKRVVVVDLDLEAPGIGLTKSTQPERSDNDLGVSDCLLGLEEGMHVPLESVAYERSGISFIRCGARRSELARSISRLAQPTGGDPFEVFLEQLRDELRPDFVFFDSRTGRADIASVGLLYLCEVAVVVTGLNEQSLRGTAEAFADLEDHPARPKRWLPLVVFSPVPPAGYFGLETEPFSRALWERPSSATANNELLDSLYEAAKMVHRIPAAFMAAREHFKAVQESDVVHGVYYDPRAPLIRDELAIGEQLPDLGRAYAKLADALERAALQDKRPA